jgi:hypothetical protein|tara:strand:- start:170 stop:739 length:570 start_codon:yes stop_codon:yes gene_type:complete
MENEIWFLESGRRRRGEKFNCFGCGKEFIRRIQGEQNCCSHECAYAYKRQSRVKIKCANCGKEARKQASKLKNAKHGFHFCSRRCKEYAQSLKGNCLQIRPDHYGTSDGREAFKHLIKKTNNPVCAGCGEDKVYLLSVHHIDGNNNNNTKSNFEIVCGNCHIKRHLKKIDYAWVYCTKALTHRDLLSTL